MTQYNSFTSTNRKIFHIFNESEKTKNNIEISLTSESNAIRQLNKTKISNYNNKKIINIGSDWDYLEEDTLVSAYKNWEVIIRGVSNRTLPVTKHMFLFRFGQNGSVFESASILEGRTFLHNNFCSIIKTNPSGFHDFKLVYGTFLRSTTGSEITEITENTLMVKLNLFLNFVPLKAGLLDGNVNIIPQEEEGLGG